MKKYIDYMKEFNEEEILEGLLGYGLFCEKLPPIFSSKEFYEYCKQNKPDFKTTNKETNYIKYESMRNINIPRCLGIPQPMNYYKLSKCISENWNLIKQHFENNTSGEKTKISRIHIRKMKNEKSIFKMNYKDFKSDGDVEIDLLMGAKFVVNVDISTCFPSMYTHALAWALAGKEVAKKDRGPNHWYNQLDFYARGTTNGETHGLLIGPHSSNLLSEIILTCVDNELSKKGWKYIRNIDDYTCYVNSNDDAQKFLVDINAELRKFNLMLNHKKTKVSQLPQTSSEKWVRKLGVLISSEKDYLDYKDIKLILDTAIELFYANSNNAAILNYIIKMIDGKELSKNAREYYKKNILHLTIIFPYLIPLIDTYIFENQKVNIKEIKSFTNNIYVEGKKTNNFEMLCYALFFAIKYKIKITDIDLEFLLKSRHCITLLLGYLYFNKIAKDKDSVKQFKELAKELVLDKDDFEENWLFVYEVLTVGFFKGVNSDWKILKQNNISFIDNQFV
ncbi:MAG: RNA-directed DNA polymerase [Psychrobacillus sp.]